MTLCAMEANSWGYVLACTGRFKALSYQSDNQSHTINVLLALSFFWDEQYNGC